LLLATRVDQSRFGVPTLRSKKADEKPFSVRRPIKPLVSILVRIVLVAGKDDASLFCFEVQDLQRCAVLQVSDLFAVRRIFRLEIFLGVFQDWMDVDDGGIEKIGFFLTCMLAVGWAPTQPLPWRHF
jgi:hypothetical protein